MTMRPYANDSESEGAFSRTNAERDIPLGMAMRPYGDPHGVDQDQLARVQAFDAGYVSVPDDYPEVEYCRCKRRGRVPYGAEHDGSGV